MGENALAASSDPSDCRSQMVGMMLMEHQFGRVPIAKMGGDSSAGAIWADAALGYVALLREHIARRTRYSL